MNLEREIDKTIALSLAAVGLVRQVENALVNDVQVRNNVVRSSSGSRFVTMLPLELSKLGFQPRAIGSLYLPIVGAFMLGAHVARRVQASLGERGSCRVGAGLGVSGALLLGLATTLHSVTSAWQLIPVALFCTR